MKAKKLLSISLALSPALALAAMLLLCGCSSGDKKPEDTPKDRLIHRLFTAVKDGKILYGHQDDLVYGHNWVVTDVTTDPLDRSDVKDVTGKYPAIVGFDLGGIERGDSLNLDGVPFELIARAAVTHVERGGIVTFSWHARNPLTGGDAWDVSSKEAVSSVLEEGAFHNDYMIWLNRLSDFFESLGDIPFIFRPYHENVGSWFWWGGDLCTPDQYKRLFGMTHGYLTKVRGLENILWCYSPNAAADPKDFMDRYPGDIFVDIIGVDSYEWIGDSTLEEAGVRFTAEVKKALTFLNTVGGDHHKLIALTETGLEGLEDPDWFSEVLYPAIKDFPIAYVLTWRNAHDRPGHFYAPWKGFAAEEDFRTFAGLEKTELLNLD